MWLSWQRICLQCWKPGFDPWVGKIPWRRNRPPTTVFLGFPCVSAGKESSCNAGDLSLIPGMGRSPREGNSYPLQYSGLENSMDCIVHAVAKSQTQLSNFDFSESAQPSQGEQRSFRWQGGASLATGTHSFTFFYLST